MLVFTVGFHLNEIFDQLIVEIGFGWWFEILNFSISGLEDGGTFSMGWFLCLIDFFHLFSKVLAIILIVIIGHFLFIDVGYDLVYILIYWVWVFIINFCHLNIALIKLQDQTIYKFLSYIYLFITLYHIN